MRLYPHFFQKLTNHPLNLIKPRIPLHPNQLTCIPKNHSRSLCPNFINTQHRLPDSKCMAPHTHKYSHKINAAPQFPCTKLINMHGFHAQMLILCTGSMHKINKCVHTLTILWKKDTGCY